MDASGSGIQSIRPKSLLDMLKAAGVGISMDQAPDHHSDGEESVDGGDTIRRRVSRTSVLVGSAKDPLVVVPEELEVVPEEQVPSAANGKKHFRH